MFKDVCSLPGAGQNCPLLLLLPSHVQIEDDLLKGGPCPIGEVVKTLPVVRLATQKIIVSVDAVAGVELLATTLEGKHIATVQYYLEMAGSMDQQHVLRQAVFVKFLPQWLHCSGKLVKVASGR